MPCTSCTVFDPSLVEYDFGASHPMNPVRVDLTMRLAEALGVVGGSGLAVASAPVAYDDLVATVHDRELIEAVRRIGEDPTRTDLARGLGTEDNPTFAGMHHASAHVVGATVEAARRFQVSRRLARSPQITSACPRANAASSDRKLAGSF